jgi:hypothetical protein
MSMRARWWLLGAGAVAVMAAAACTSTSASESESPAVLQTSSDATRAVIAAAVKDMLQGAQVTLAEDALVHDSRITVERVRPRDTKGQLLNGRVLERPEQFQLLKQQGQCVLVHQGSGRRKVLESVGCSVALAR